MRTDGLRALVASSAFRAFHTPRTLRRGTTARQPQPGGSKGVEEAIIAVVFRHGLRDLVQPRTARQGSQRWRRRMRSYYQGSRRKQATSLRRSEMPLSERFSTERKHSDGFGVNQSKPHPISQSPGRRSTSRCHVKPPWPSAANGHEVIVNRRFAPRHYSATWEMTGDAGCEHPAEPI